jgi:hypothetical protein
VLDGYVADFDLGQGHSRDKEVVCIHFANEYAGWLGLVSCLYRRAPSLPIESCGLSLCSRDTKCRDAVGLRAQDQICCQLHGLMYAAGEAEAVSKCWRALLNGNMGKKYD